MVAGRPGADEGPASGATEQDAGTDGAPKDTDGIGGGTQGRGTADNGAGPGSTTAARTGSGSSPDAAGDEAAIRLTPDEEAVWREIARLMKGADGAAPTESPAEVIRLFKVLRAVVIEPKFGTTGESWIRFAHFLDLNKAKIEGYFRSEKGGRITSAVLQKIVAEYGVYLGATKDQEGPAELRTDKDFDKEFAYDPGWQRLSPTDRKLLLDYIRTTGSPGGDKKIDFLTIGTTQKIMMALRLADTSLLGEMADAAKTAFHDPRFFVTLVVTMGIYVGLWLTPDPEPFTKAAAAFLTGYMLTQFAIADIYGFAVAWSDLADGCTKATTTADLKTAGEAFFKRIGPIGFDIMMFIVMWRIGKVRPQAVGEGRRDGRQAGPEPRRRDSGTAGQRFRSRGRDRPQPGGDGSHRGRRRRHPDADPRYARDASAGCSQGRTDEVSSIGQVGRDVLDALEDSKAPIRLLTEKAMTPSRYERRGQTPRRRGSIWPAPSSSPPRRSRIRRCARRYAQSRLVRSRRSSGEAGTWDTPEFQDALLRGDIAAIGRMLRQVVEKVRTAARNARSTETQGAIGESLQRSILRTQYAGRAGVQFRSNLAVMKQLPGVRTIADWAQAEQARIRAEEPTISSRDLNARVQKGFGKLFEKDGHLYEAIGEVDTMVVEPGPDGRLHILEMAEAKTGRTARPSKAAEQLTDVLTELRQIGDKTSTAQVFELQGKRGLGQDITRQLALDALQQEPAMRTFGPDGNKPWDVTLGYTEAEFKAMAESLLRNLPPDKLPTARPPTAARKKADDQH